MTELETIIHNLRQEGLLPWRIFFYILLSALLGFIAGYTEIIIQAFIFVIVIGCLTVWFSDNRSLVSRLIVIVCDLLAFFLTMSLYIALKD